MIKLRFLQVGDVFEFRPEGAVWEILETDVNLTKCQSDGGSFRDFKDRDLDRYVTRTVKEARVTLGKPTLPPWVRYYVLRNDEGDYDECGNYYPGEGYTVWCFENKPEKPENSSSWLMNGGRFVEIPVVITGEDELVEVKG